MAKDRPLHSFEAIDESDPLIQLSWVVEERHHGHTRTVLGRVLANNLPTKMCVVGCSCGEEFRMTEDTILSLRGER